MEFLGLGENVWATIAIVGGVGAIAGLIGGFLASADNLLGTVLMGAIGGIVASAFLRIANAPPILEIDDGWSWLWAAAGGLILGFVVGRAN